MSVRIVVMGVAGCGKSTVGRLLAERMGAEFAEGDAFHPAANVAKMATGQPLNDGDRYPWLEAIGGWIETKAQAGQSGVVACSALKHRYRELLRMADPSLRFLHLDITREMAFQRVADRPGHFMPSSLVDSQFATLEPLCADELGIVVDGSQLAEDLIRTAARSFGRL